MISVRPGSRRTLPIAAPPPEVFERSIPDCFSEQARRDPKATALLCDATTVSFGELELASRGLAGGLVGRFGHGRRPVAVALPLGIPALVAMLGVLRAGKMLTPVDSSLDASSLAAIEQFGAECVVCEEAAIRRRTPPGAVSVVSYEQLLAAGAEADVASRPGEIATILSTSGSQGRPKGVGRSHRCELHASLTAAAGLDLSPGDRLGLMFPLKFGAAIWWALTALLQGASLQLHDLSRKGLLGLGAAIVRDEVTALLLIPSLLREFAAIAQPTDLRAVRTVVMGGERLLASDLDAARHAFPADCAFVHALGATEAPMIAWSLCDRRDEDELALQPFPDTSIAIVGEDRAPVPTGEGGELVVSSGYLASGYRGDRVLTAAAFKATSDGRTSYRTGDHGWFDGRGRLHLSGRRDQQVKVRGQRVELGAVEAAIVGLPGVRTAAVAVRETAGRVQLVSYVVAADGVKVLTPGEVQLALRGILPDAAIPSLIELVDELPMLPSGKVDRAAIGQAARGRRTP
jgi:acyl-coenzyme A synthetase/AMP-(fatty) acid ligase